MIPALLATTNAGLITTKKVAGNDISNKRVVSQQPLLAAIAQDLMNAVAICLKPRPSTLRLSPLALGMSMLSLALLYVFKNKAISPQPRTSTELPLRLTRNTQAVISTLPFFFMVDPIWSGPWLIIGRSLNVTLSLLGGGMLRPVKRFA